MDFGRAKRNCVPLMIFKNGRLVFPNGVRDGLDLVAENGMITAIRAQAAAIGETIVDLEAIILRPGLIIFKSTAGWGGEKCQRPPKLFARSAIITRAAGRRRCC